MALKDIKGQDRAIEILKRSVEQKRIAHAYLFLGPQGTGKRKTALEFAKLLNCRNKKDDCCNSCDSCIKIDKAMHPDVMVVSREKDTYSNISIEKIREIQNRLSFKPYEAEYKIAVITDAQDLSEEASNCLLKVLEEPTPDSLLILTASNKRTLAATIISRCQVIRFKPLTMAEVKRILTEDFSIGAQEADFLSALSGSNIGKALLLKEKDAISWKNSIIDKFSGFSNGPDKDEEITLGKQRQIQLEAMDVLLGFYRDILVYKFLKDDSLIINVDRIDKITRMAADIDTDRIKKAIDDIEQIRASIVSNANLKLAASVLKERLALKDSVERIADSV